MSDSKKSIATAEDVADIEIDGIQLKVDRDLINDWDFMEQLSEVMAIQDELSDDGADPVAAGKALVGMSNLANALYGSDFKRIKKELRSKNDGKLPMETVLRFIMDTISAMGKN